MIRATLISLACFALAAPAFAQVAVKGDWVTLGDVTPVTGDAAKVLVGQAPPAGQTLALDPNFLVALAGKSGVVLAIPLDKPVMVTRASVAGAPAAPVAPIARTAPQARQAPQPPMIVSQAAPEGWVLVLARDVARGQVLDEDDLRWADPSSGPRPRMQPDLDGAVGMETKRLLKAGYAISMSDIKEPALVKKGEPVKIVYASPGIRLTVDGLAQADAGKGEPVRILNSYSKRSIDAVATGPGEASVRR